MRDMKPAHYRHIGGTAPGVVNIHDDDLHACGFNCAEDGIQIHAARGSLKLPPSPQSIRQQPRLNLVGIGNEHANSVGLMKAHLSYFSHKRKFVVN